MSQCASIPIILALLLNACQPIVVRIGERHKGDEALPSFPASSDVVVSDSETWNSIEDFLLNLEAIKQMGKDALLRRYHETGRQQIRQVFRDFRDAISSHADRDPSSTLPYLGSLEAGLCLPIPKQDIFELGSYGDLQALLETVFLAKINPSKAMPDPSLPSDMDEITKLGFFELGIAMDGKSFFSADDRGEKQGSDLRWKVIHEQRETSDRADQDENSVKFRFLRTSTEANSNIFRMEARVGPLVYEEEDSDILPSLFIDYQKELSSSGESFQSMLIQTGLRKRDGYWQNLRLSRKIMVRHDPVHGHILHVTVHEHFQQPRELVEKFRLDRDAKNLCSEIGTE